MTNRRSGFYVTNHEFFWVTSGGEVWMLSDYMTVTMWRLFKEPRHVASLPKGASHRSRSWASKQPNSRNINDKLWMIAGKSK